MGQEHSVVHPSGWPPPKGYSNGIIAAPGRHLAIAGQIAWDTSQRIVSDEFVPQFAQALSNVLSVVDAAGGAPESLVHLTIFVTDLEAYRGAQTSLGEAYRKLLGNHYPAMSLVQVTGLVEPRALVEIEATAILPPEPC